MISRCSGDSRINAWRSNSPRSFFCKAASGSSAGSATVASIFSSSSASIRRRRADNALKRAMDIIHVETEERPSKRSAWRQTSRNTSLNRSSASVVYVDEAHQPAVDGSPMPGEQGLHGELVATYDPFNQHFV